MAKDTKSKITWVHGTDPSGNTEGQFVADAIRASVRNAGFPADIALEASGYIAAAVPEGKVVGNDIMRAVPYGYDPASGLGDAATARTMASVRASV